MFLTRKTIHAEAETIFYSRGKFSTLSDIDGWGLLYFLTGSKPRPLGAGGTERQLRVQRPLSPRLRKGIRYIRLKCRLTREPTFFQSITKDMLNLDIIYLQPSSRHIRYIIDFW